MSLTTAEDPTPQAEDSADDELPGGIEPLWKQCHLERYYGVSNWTVNEWIKDGMPVKWIKAGKRRGRRFEFAAVEAWHADNVEQLPASA